MRTQPFTAVLIQYVHSAPWKERLNLGAALDCPGMGFAQVRFVHSVTRVSQAFGADAHALKQRLALLRQKLADVPPGNLLKALSELLPPNFDAGVVIGHEMRGITDEPAAMLASLVERFEPREQVERDGLSAEP